MRFAGLLVVAVSGCNGGRVRVGTFVTLLAGVCLVGCSAGDVSRPADSATAGTSSSAFIWSEDRGVREITLPAGVSELIPVDINESGQVAGIAVWPDGYNEAFEWSESGGLKRTRPASGVYGTVVVNGLTADGVVVGYVLPKSGSDVEAFAWSPRAGMIAPTGERISTAGINSAGSIVGDRSGFPVLWTKASGFTPLAITGYECTSATAINEFGDIIGWAGDDQNGFGCIASVMVAWRGSARPEELVACPATKLGDLEITAFNSAGEVAGTLNGNAFRASVTCDYQIQTVPGAFANDMNSRGDVALELDSLPFVWTRNGERRAVPLLPGKTKGRATAINDQGVVVGIMH